MEVASDMRPEDTALVETGVDVVSISEVQTAYRAAVESSAIGKVPAVEAVELEG
jgi:hypothetical protein